MSLFSSYFKPLTVNSTVKPDILEQQTRDKPEVVGMPDWKQIFDRLSVYIPNAKDGEEIGRTLHQPGREEKRSVNYLMVEAALEYAMREERKG